MTVMGIAAIRLITAEEGMATGFYDRALAFQATEAALKDVEAEVESRKPVPLSKAAQVADCGDVDGIRVCRTPAFATTSTTGADAGAAPVERWADKLFSGWKERAAYTSGSISVIPDYFVEYLGNEFPCNPGDADAVYECKRYRITARVKGGAGRASVMLQSIYATE